MAAESRKTSPPSPKRLLTVFGCAAAVILAVGTFMYRYHDRAHRQVVEEQLAAVAELKVRELARWREERLADAAIFFDNGAFSALIRRVLEHPDDRDARGQLHEWLESAYAFRNYRHIRLVDAQGVTRIAIPGDLPPVPADILGQYAEILRRRAPQLADFFRDDTDGKSYLALRVPLYDETHDRRPLGVLSMRIDVEDYLCSFILNWPTPDPSAETVLAYRDGGDAVVLGTRHCRQDSPLSRRIPLALTDEPAVQAISGRTGLGEGTDYRGVAVMADIRPVPGTPWFLVTSIDAAEALAPAREHQLMTLGLMAALLTVAGTSVTLVWRQQRLDFYREQARAAAELQEINERFALFMRHSPVYVFIKEISGTESRVLQVSDNFEQMVGIPAARLRGRTMTEIFPAEFAARITADDLAVVSRGEVLTLDEEFNGRHYTTVKFPIPQGDKVLLAGYTVDITGRKRAEEEVQELARDLLRHTQELEGANQELEAFSYSLTHDLRSYLARISLAGEALLEFENEHLGSQSKFCLQTILDSCHGMDGLIATMLTLARVTRQEMKYESVDLSALAGRIGSEMTLAEPDRSLRFEIMPGLCVHGDPELLEVMLRNLFGNACKYTREKAEACISLTVKDQDGRQVFAVADNGVGFDMKDAGKIFQPFQRLGSARGIPGFGIGLTTAQRIIQRHGGEIWAESTPGDGATFFFTIPMQGN